MRREGRERIEDYLRNMPVRKVQLGAGPNFLDGWLNTDYEPTVAGLVFLDVTREFPLPSGCLDFNFSEHLIEHVSHQSALFMLNEAFRTLRPGGTIRVATPNLQNFLSLFGTSDSLHAKRYVEWSVEMNQFPQHGTTACFVLNNMLRAWGHQFIYDPATLESTLRKAGFSDIVLCGVGESRHPELRDLESHGLIIGEENNLFETMVLEGTRPI
jgi:predicted SAM-dependent methyltransferase